MVVTEFRDGAGHVVGLLGAYYMDALGEDEFELVTNHLTGCAACRVQAEETVATVAALAMLHDQEDATEIGGEADADLPAGPPDGAGTAAR